MSLAAVGGSELTRGFLSAVERGQSSISLKALDLVAERLRLPLSYFVDDRPLLKPTHGPATINHVEAALAYGRYLRARGNTEEALEYALWAAEQTVDSQQPGVASGEATISRDVETGGISEGAGP